MENLLEGVYLGNALEVGLGDASRNVFEGCPLSVPESISISAAGLIPECLPLEWAPSVDGTRAGAMENAAGRKTDCRVE